MKSKKTARLTVLTALIAAAYVALTYLSASMGLAFGQIQFRLSEALNILAAFTPAAIPGLTIGCFLSNITSPFPLDMAFGTLATLLSAIMIRLIAKHFKKSTPYLAIIPPTFFNAVIVGLQITLFTNSNASFLAFLLVAISVAIGEMVVCSAIGIPLYYGTNKYLKKYL